MGLRGSHLGWELGGAVFSDPEMERGCGPMRWGVMWVHPPPVEFLWLCAVSSDPACLRSSQWVEVAKRPQSLWAQGV